MSTENIHIAHSGVGNQYEVYEAANASHDEVALFSLSGMLAIHFSDTQPNLSDVFVPINNIASGNYLTVSKANTSIWVLLAPSQQLYVIRGEAKLGGLN